MTPLQMVKELTSYTDDTKINLLIEMVQDEIVNICKLDTYDIELNNVLVEMVIVKLNRQGQEGLSNISMSGMSETYLDEYPHYITNRLKKYIKRVVMH